MGEQERGHSLGHAADPVVAEVPCPLLVGCAVDQGPWRGADDSGQFGDQVGEDHPVRGHQLRPGPVGLRDDATQDRSQARERTGPPLVAARHLIEWLVGDGPDAVDPAAPRDQKVWRMLGHVSALLLAKPAMDERPPALVRLRCET